MSRPLWGGRFERSPSEAASAFTSSIAFDIRLWPYDIAATRAHANALLRGGILTNNECDLILRALDEAAGLFSQGTFEIDPSDEDIHSAIERFLIARLGDTGAKIHAGRSRNDLSVTGLRLWLKSVIPSIAGDVYELEQTLYRLARAHVQTVMPGFTHLQRAQPIVLAHHLLAHAFALTRDFERVISSYRRADLSTLGAAALSGTSIPIDPKGSATEMGFAKVFDNAMDAVSSRDFALEFLSASAILSAQLSRLAEEIILWTSSEFGFAELDDSQTTGSSIMPQKKNPDTAELVRAKTARVNANLQHLLGVVKGLPLSYNRDLQEDKEAVFDTADTVRGMLSVLRAALLTIRFNEEVMSAAASDKSLLATDIAEALVMKGVPFREAHSAVGALVGAAARAGRQLGEFNAEELNDIHPMLGASFPNTLDARGSVATRVSHGGTSPDRVAEQIRRLETVMDDQERWLAGFNTGG
ncbi:MAG TPA: argininosuccinate lyase [Actinomycetota bacterium]|nr:argininosuccinate lyase [Actinomycetota bacterium]